MKKYKNLSSKTSYNVLPDYPYVVEVTGDSDGRRQKVQMQNLKVLELLLGLILRLPRRILVPSRES